MSAAILKRIPHGIGGVLPFRNKRSSKLPLSMYSYTKHPYSGQAPIRSTMFGCLMQLRTSTFKDIYYYYMKKQLRGLQLAYKYDVIVSVPLVGTAFFLVQHQL